MLQMSFCGFKAGWGRLAVAMQVVTFTTDFGTTDAYAGAMKGVVLSLAPRSVLVDITHAIPRHDVRAGAWVLAESAPCFPPGSVHVAVVDPGVGGPRAGLVVEAAGHLFVGPDNGLLTLAAFAPRRVFRIENPLFRRARPSPTFHGRDVFAVAAGRLAEGLPACEAGPAAETMTDLFLPASGCVHGDGEGEVVHIDVFGNLVTSFPGGEVEGRWELICANRGFELRGGRTFSDVPPGRLVCYEGSSGRIEIAVREGSAAALTGCQVGTSIHLRRRS